MNVHILVSCRNPDLWRASTLIFDTIRVGFPGAKIIATDNGLEPAKALQLEMHMADIEGHSIFKKRTVHHEWIAWLLETSTEPFVICDTDVIFWDRVPVERFEHERMAGRYTPRFYDQVTGCITHHRLHTCLLYINPVEVRKAMEGYYSQFPKMPFDNMRPDLIKGAINPVYESGKLTSYFHDTCSMLYQVCGGMRFDEAILNCFDHLHAATYLDLIESRMDEGRRLALSHKKIFDNPALAKGIWRKQDEYYAKHAR